MAGKNQKSQKLTEALEKGTVIKFEIPFFTNNGNAITGIDKIPCIEHYAVVLGKTGYIRDKRFNGRNAIKLTHKRRNPDVPFLSADSFKSNRLNQEEINAHFRNEVTNPHAGSYSVINRRYLENAVCCIHNDYHIPGYTFVGVLKDDIRKQFEKYYNQNREKMNHLLVDKSGEPYLVKDPYLKNPTDEKYLMNSQGEWVPRSAINESLILEIESQPGVVLMLIPDEYVEDLVFEENPVVIRRVIPHDDYTIQLNFSNGQRGVYDVLPLISQEITDNDSFSLLEDLSLFSKIQNYGDSIAWDDDTAIGIDELYDNCMTLKSYKRWRDRDYR